MTTTTATTEEERQPGLGEAFGRWSAELRPLVGAMSDLAISEARLAAVSLVSMFAAAVALAVLAAVAWASLAAAVGLWIFAGTQAWIMVGLWTTLISIIGALAAYLLIRRLSGHLDFKATRGLLLGERSSRRGIPDVQAASTQQRSGAAT